MGQVTDYHFGGVSGWLEIGGGDKTAKIITSDFIDWMIMNVEGCKGFWNAFDAKMIAMPDAGHQRCVLVHYSGFLEEHQRWGLIRPNDLRELIGQYIEDADIVLEEIEDDY